MKINGNLLKIGLCLCACAEEGEEDEEDEEEIFLDGLLWDDD